MLQENEEEKLSKEEQDLAWEVYQKTLVWEEVRRASPDEPIAEPAVEQNPITEPAVQPKPDPKLAPKLDHALERARQRHQYRYGLRHCTNLAHLLTLSTQGVKAGGHAICGECARVLRWEELQPDPRCCTVAKRNT